MKFKLLMILAVGLISTNSSLIRAAAEPLEEGFIPISGYESATNALFIQNDSVFNLVVSYQRVNALPSDRFLPKGGGIDISNPATLVNQITIRLQIPFEQYGLYDFFSKIPGLTAMSTLGGQLARNIVPYYGTFESMVSYVRTIAKQTISIDPKSYTPGTIFVFYWPLGLASLNYPPMIIPLANANAAMAWTSLQDTLDNALRTGLQGAKTAYHVIQNFATGQKGLNSEQIGTIETIVKDSLPTAVPQPRTEGIIEEYEQQSQAQ